MNWMAAGSLAGAVVLGGAVVVLTIVVVRLLLYRASESNAPAAEEFSLLRYQPMMRLTSEEDFEFLAAQPGYRKEIGMRLRRERRRIFRMYLGALSADFRSLHAAARQMVADSPERHADLVGSLVGCQFTFWRRMLLVELRLLMPTARLPKLDIRSLLEPMESLRLHMADPA
jgi:hypothetical protein